MSRSRASSRAHLRARQPANMRKPCTVTGCTSRRNGMSVYCRAHHQRRAHHGHPEGGHIPKADLTAYLPLLRGFLDRHEDHPAVLAAIAWLDALIVNARRYTRHPTIIEELDRLHANGLRGREALEAVGAVFMLNLVRPGDLPDDDRLSFALAHALVYSRQRGSHQSIDPTTGAKRWHHPRLARKTSAYRELGGLLRRHMGIFFLNVSKAVVAEHDAEQELRLHMATPFTFTPADDTTTAPLADPSAAVAHHPQPPSEN